jgi:uncharacterized protein (UPF0212 family)
MTEHNYGLTKCPTCGHEAAAASEPSCLISLLACPCCGGKADFDCVNEAANEWLVRCTVCDLNTVPRSREETAAQWNKRVQANTPDEREP